MIDTNGFYGDCVRVLICLDNPQVSIPLIVHQRPLVGEYIHFGPLQTALSSKEKWEFFKGKMFRVTRVVHEHGHEENVFSLAVYVVAS